MVWGLNKTIKGYNQKWRDDHKVRVKENLKSLGNGWKICESENQVAKKSIIINGESLLFETLKQFITDAVDVLNKVSQCFDEDKDNNPNIN